MRKSTVIYWIFTGLLVLLMGGGSIPNIMSSPESAAMFEHLGYPAYLLPFLGAAKLLGCAAIVVPGFPRIKEWAYAGLTFDLTGAMYSMIAVGDSAVMFVIGYVLIAGSYVYYHKLGRGVTAGKGYVKNAGNHRDLASSGAEAGSTVS